MTTDLKELAEAAKAAWERYTTFAATFTVATPDAIEKAKKEFDHYMDVSQRYRRATEPDAILALIRERDEAIKSSDAVCDSYAEENQRLFDRAETAEAALASYKEEVERLRGALGTIADLHIPDQPAHFGGDELEWAQRHVGTLRRLAIETLTKEPPHAG